MSKLKKELTFFYETTMQNARFETL